MNYKTGIIAVVVLVGGYLLFKESAEVGGSQQRVRARLTDVRGTPLGAPVTLAGLRVGTVVERRVGSNYAEIDMEFADRIDLREDATLYKRRISILSGPSLEIDPGTSETSLQGIYILRVIEADPIGEVLYEIGEALPAVRELAHEGTEAAETWRARVKGPLATRIMDFDDETARLEAVVHRRLEKMNSGLKRSENYELDVAAKVNPVLDRSEELAIKANSELRRGKEWTTTKAEEIRERVREFDLDPAKYRERISAIDSGKDSRGEVDSLGRLVNSSEPYDDFVTVTKGTRNLFRTLTEWQIKAGGRVELGMSTGQAKAYVTMRVGRRNRFYYGEIVVPPEGGTPSITVSYDHETGGYRRDYATVGGAIRFSLQWARRYGDLMFRFGIKESTFGMGGDYALIDDRLQISADIFEFGRNDNPRVKLAATYRIFSELYLLAGIDNVFNPLVQYDIQPLGVPEPKIFDSLYIGREVYLGAILEFTDNDLFALLRIGGEVLFGLAPEA